jgi:hypothetical protein
VYELIIKLWGIAQPHGTSNSAAQMAAQDPESEEKK